MTVQELKDFLRTKGVQCSGNRKELLDHVEQIVIGPNIIL